ncbi:hypothetical protein EBR57_09920 [bacterium]|nr:hypothetical protein [bacterium]
MSISSLNNTLTGGTGGNIFGNSGTTGITGNFAYSGFTGVTGISITGGMTGNHLINCVSSSPNQIVYDISGGNNGFTVPSTGTYHISGNVQMFITATSTNNFVVLRCIRVVNGSKSVIYRSLDNGSHALSVNTTGYVGSFGSPCPFSFLYSLNAGDKIYFDYITSNTNVYACASSTVNIYKIA